MTSLNKPGPNKGIKFIIGKSVTVTVTGTYTVKGEFSKRQTVNCGNILLEDGTVDRPAFVIGIDKPLTEFTGDIIAVIRSREERRDLWVVAPAGKVFYEPAIKAMLSRFVKVRNPLYVCLYEKSCGAVMYTEEDGVREFILIKNMSGHIGFPKGHMEFNETERLTAIREMYEETGVRTDILNGFSESYNYSVNSFVRKTAVYFVAPFKKEQIEMNIREISEYILVTFEKGMKILGYSHDRTVLSKANKFIDSLSSKDEQNVQATHN